MPAGSLTPRNWVNARYTTRARTTPTIRSRNVERLPQSADFVKTSGFTGFARPIREQLVGDTRQALYVLQAGVYKLAGTADVLHRARRSVLWRHPAVS